MDDSRPRARGDYGKPVTTLDSATFVKGYIIVEKNRHLS